MNIKHVDLPEGFLEEMGDKLEFLLRTQYDAEAEYLDIEQDLGYQVPLLPLDVNNRFAQQYFKNGVYRCIEELSETTNCLRNREHTQTEYATDEEHFIEELSDSFHYFLRLFWLLGLDADDVVKLYFKKSEVNKFRRETKY